MIRDREDPQHYTWHGLFCQYSWWISSENKVFVILSRTREFASPDNPEGFNMASAEILYKHTEYAVTIAWVDLVQWFKDGKLRKTSVKD